MKRLCLPFTIAFLTASLVRAQPTAEELQANRQRFEQIRKRPEQLEKLRNEAKAFRELPEDRQQQIAELHEQLQREAPATQARLQTVLDRYAEWLGSLDKATRDKIEQTTDKQKRLAVIREIREQQWLKEQPKALRDKIAALEGAERKALIAKEKEEERRRRVEWIIASRFWNELEGEKGRKLLPTKFAELPLSVRYYVRDYLLKMFLSQEEKDQLAAVEGQWPQYPMKLVELAAKHPAALPGENGPKFVKDLPNEVLVKLRLVKNDAVLPLPKKEARLLEEGKWPAFGTSLAKFAKQRTKTTLDHEFLAYDRDCLTKEMQAFLEKRLQPALNRDEFQRLYHAEGKWPDYPKTIQELADNHQLRPPWFILPQLPGEDWNKYRLAAGRR